MILQKEGNKKNFHFLYNSFKNKIKNLWPEGIVAVKLSQLSYKYALWNVALKKNDVTRKCYKLSHSSLIKNNLMLLWICLLWMGCRRCCVSTGWTSAPEIFMQGLVCQAWNSKPGDPIPSAVIRNSNGQFMLSFLISGLYYLYGGHIPTGLFGCDFYVFVDWKRSNKENMVQVFAAKCQLPTGVDFFSFIESVLVVRSELSLCLAFG